MLNYPHIDFVRVDKTGFEAANILCLPINSKNKGNEIADEMQQKSDGVFALFCFTGFVEFSLNEQVIRLEQRNMSSFFTSNLYKLINCSKDFTGYLLFLSSYYILNIESHIAITFFLNSYSEPILELQPEDAKDLRILLTLASDRLAKEDRRYSKEVVYNMLMILLLELVEIYERKQGQEKKQLREEGLLKEFLILINNFCEKEHYLSFYADKLGITPKHLSLTVKKLTGRTAAEWIDYVLMLKIKRMLINSPLSIQQISDYFNFPDNSAFGKYFKMNAGITPRNYRTL